MANPDSASIGAIFVGVSLMSGILGTLKGGSLYFPAWDPLACREAIQAGAECSTCETSFKFCRGHYVYEPTTVLIFEAACTVLLGVIAAFCIVGVKGLGQVLLNPMAIRLSVPIALIYAVADVAEFTAWNISAACCYLATASQMRLLFSAVLRWIMLGRRQSANQWCVLFLITLLSLVREYLSSTGNFSKDLGMGWDILAMVLVAAKCSIRCAAAIYGEYFMQYSEAAQLPLWATQVYFKGASLTGNLMTSFVYKGTWERMMAKTWAAEQFRVLPPGATIGSSRLPFFGGWNMTTFALAFALVVNNFLIGSQLRKLNAVAKYAAYDLAVALTSIFQYLVGFRPNGVELLCSISLAVFVACYPFLAVPAAPGDKPKAS